MTQILYTSTHQLALLWLDLQRHGLQAVEHLDQSFQMFLLCPPVDDNVVWVHQADLECQPPQSVFHHPLDIGMTQAE
ncbi:hypothetical protein T07_8145 [Trichinella nelsoni]|uniref:Uncharacterized protein n=1 Tax=Trichinella nelsoni TaxID=6336 RepID=A0A0V0RW33_9BILA|nr:hypothetical protein T07_8145 [Trichinella nelsoni]